MTTTRGKSETVQRYEQAMRKLRAAARGEGEAAKLATALLPLLEHLPIGEGIERRARRSEARVRYIVEGVGTAATLAEYRSAAESPLRCPKSVFDAVVDVIDKAAGPLSTGGIGDAVHVTTGTRAGDFQLRIVLRLLMHTVPPLLSRSRARYLPSSRPGFRTAAARAWSGLRVN